MGYGRIWTVIIVGFLLVLRPALTGADPPDTTNRLTRFSSELHTAKAALLTHSARLIELGRNLSWQDRLYLNRIVMSVNAMETCLFYQYELAGAYAEMARIGKNLAQTQIVAMIRQLEFTRACLQIEHKRVTLQYLQVMDARMLTHLDRMIVLLKNIQRTIAAHLDWVRNLAPESQI